VARGKKSPPPPLRGYKSSKKPGYRIKEKVKENKVELVTLLLTILKA